MANPETRLVNRIRDTIEQRYPGSWIVKIHGGPFQQAGLPDLFILYRGIFIGMEVKCPQPGETDDHARERTTLRQRAVLTRINAAGGYGGVVVSVDEAVTLMQSALELARRA